MKLRDKNTSRWLRRQLQREECKRNLETNITILKFPSLFQLHYDIFIDSVHNTMCVKQEIAVRKWVFNRQRSCMNVILGYES